MRLPYLQVAQETWSRARALSGALGVDRHRAMSLIMDLWSWAVDLGRDDEPPTGAVPGTGSVSAKLIAGAVEWKADPGELVIALRTIGMLDVDDSGSVRVCGMDRYRRTWEKNKRRKPAPVVPVTGTIRAGTGAKPAPQTQTQTQTQKKEEERPPFFLAQSQKQDGNPPAHQKPAVDAAGKSASSQTGDSLRDRMEAEWHRAIGTPYAWTQEDDLAMRPLLQRGTEAQIVERWRRAIVWVGFPTCNRVKDLATHWNAYAKEQPKAADARGDRPRL